MKLYAIWIDFERAFIIISDNNDVISIRELTSGADPRSKTTWSEGEHLTLTDDTGDERRHENQIKGFCKDIVDQLADADEIVVFGPGEAKHTLKHCVEDVTALSPKLKAVETAHPLSEAEMKDWVRKQFALPR